MKRIYIKPEAELLDIKVTQVIAASDPSTNWGIGSQEIGNEEPDPNEDAKQSIGLWEEDTKSPNIWSDEE